MQLTNKVTPPTLSAEPEQQRQAFYAALRLVTIDYRRRSGHKAPPNASGFPCRSVRHVDQWGGSIASLVGMTGTGSQLHSQSKAQTKQSVRHVDQWGGSIASLVGMTGTGSQLHSQSKAQTKQSVRHVGQ